jgi:hypothetical protein
MLHVAPSEVLPERSPRSPFKYPVRVTIAGSRVVRVLSGDLSPNGMFLCMPEPPEEGTCVALAFEAGGKVLPFAEGEVAWRRPHAKGGFGVRFTRFVHPRARALVEYLCSNVEGGTTLKVRPTPPGRARWTGLAVLAAALIALVAARLDAPTPEVVLDPSAVCRAPALAAAADPAPHATPAVKPARRKQARLAEGPRAEPQLTRTISSAAKPAPFSSTPIPSGAARLVTATRVGGAVRLSVDVVASGHVTAVRALSKPARVVLEVSGLPPIAQHVLPLNDPELRRITAQPKGRLTQLVVELARAPSRVVQQGDTALISY